MSAMQFFHDRSSNGEHYQHESQPRIGARDSNQETRCNQGSAKAMKATLVETGFVTQLIDRESPVSLIVKSSRSSNALMTVSIKETVFSVVPCASVIILDNNGPA